MLYYFYFGWEMGILMKFKTRLRVVFITIIVLPMVLAAVAFFAIGLYLMNAQKGLSFGQMDYDAMSESMQEVVEATDRAYHMLWEQVQEDPSRLEDLEYLEYVNSRTTRRSTYIIVRKDEELY